MSNNRCSCCGQTNVCLDYCDHYNYKDELIKQLEAFAKDVIESYDADTSKGGSWQLKLERILTQ